MASSSSNTPANTNVTVTSSSVSNLPIKTYKYSTEISQMCYVFEQGYNQPEEEVLHYIEDVVRSQLLEIVSILSSFNPKANQTGNESGITS